jgi:CDP-diacylglycerol--serine O-phosphatidyltransferase
MKRTQPETNPAVRRRRLGRSIFILPSLFTVGNIFCGYYAIISSMRGQYDHAAQAIGIAIILDMLDGRIARLTNSATDFGLQLDSLADVISFGVAPSVLAFLWGFDPINHRLGWAAAFTFTICGAMRLARFNVQAGGLKHFLGLPIPAGGGTIAAIVHFFPEPITDPVGATTMVGCVFALALLMVSTLRYSSMKYLTLGRKSHLIVLVIALLFVSIFFYSRWALLILAGAYVSSGLLQKLYALARRKKSIDDLPLSDQLEHS